MTGENWQTYSKIYSSGGLSGLSDLVQQKLLRGDRPGVIDIGRYVASQGITDPLIVRHEINSLLVLGDETAAENLFDSFRASDIFDSNYVAMLELYFARYRQGFCVDDNLLDLRERLIDVIGRNLASSAYLSRLMPFSDIVLISNSVGLSFSEVEKQCLLTMKRPLFVYFNVGNPTLCAGRSGFYCPAAAEVVLGSYQHAVGADHRLIFQPLHGHEFLGCIMRIEQKWCIEWRDVWRAEFQRVNPGLSCHEFKEVGIIESLYPSSASSDAPGERRRIPTIGSIAVALADALLHMPESQVEGVWAAGFSMSASYIFEACYGINLHDFPFEKIALESRVASDAVKLIGSINAALPEVGARRHLQHAGLSVEKLNRQLRSRRE